MKKNYHGLRFCLCVICPRGLFARPLRTLPRLEERHVFATTSGAKETMWVHCPETTAYRCRDRQGYIVRNDIFTR